MEHNRRATNPGHLARPEAAGTTRATRLRHARHPVDTGVGTVAQSRPVLSRIRLKTLIGRIPFVGRLARQVYRWSRPFPGSEEYWQKRYAAGGDSGLGSYGRFSEFKAEVVNAFVAEQAIASVIEFGCGDGNQLSLARYRSYLGLDVSAAAVATCRRRFASDPGKTFRIMREYEGERADLALSLDVIFHLVEDQVFESHMRMLFDAADRYVIIYSSDSDDNRASEYGHVRHRRFTEWLRANVAGWSLLRHVPNKYPYHGDAREGSFAEFFIYAREEPRPCPS
jgi:SAM-dependent methyltransferase